MPVIDDGVRWSEHRPPAADAGRRGSRRLTGGVVPAVLAAWMAGCFASALASGLEASRSAPDPAGVDASEPAVRLAEELLATIPPGSWLALRPLVPHETGLPREVGRRLYESILNAMSRASRARGVILLPRESLGRIYKSLYEFSQGNVETMLEAAKADIEVICEVFSVAEGVDLSCGAWDLEKTFSHSRAMVRFSLKRETKQLDLAVPEIARRLVEDAPVVGEVAQVIVMDASIGTRGELGNYIGKLLEEKLIEEMSERARTVEQEARVREALGTEPKPLEEELVYRIEGTMVHLDDSRMRLTVRMKHGERSVVMAGADISVSSLPANLFDGIARGMVGQTFEAFAEAVVSEHLDRAAALRAARNLARARVVAQALGPPVPGISVARTEAEAARVFSGFLDRGLPVDERFTEVWSEDDSEAEERVAIRLAARVVPIGSAIRPRVRARLDRGVYRKLQNMRIEILSEERVYIGLFGWGADNRVVRIYPNKRARIETHPGETLVLPRPGDGQISSAPLDVPRNFEDHEALVVVASARSIDFGRLAPEAGASFSSAMQHTVDGSSFLAGLAAQHPAHMAVIWLPYQVHE